MNQDKLQSQSEGYVLLDDFDAGPLTGPGRWATFPDGTILYTNDSNVLFAKSPKDTRSLTDLVVAITALYEAGRTATSAFDLLSQTQIITSGDLSEIA